MITRLRQERKKKAAADFCFPLNERGQKAMHQDKKRFRGEYIIIQKLPPSPQGGTFFELENENLDHASGAFFVAFHSFLFGRS